MALTGKTIGQLTYLQYPTNDTLIPVELSGDTFHIAFSAVNYTELTYSDLVTGANLGELSPGHFYLMTDFQTIYDQPNFDYNGDPILTGNNKTGSTEPLLLLATEIDRFAPTVYSPLHPHDKITYDITWTTTEVTNTPAKGRITERIDEFGNRTDYDHRSILFRRYKSYFQDGNISGRIIEMNNGLVTGLNTNFTSDLTTGDTIWIMSINPQMYEVISIESTTGMTVAGFNYSNFTDPVGVECEIMITVPASGGLYYFNDVGSNDISDGGNDMYDGANKIYTNLFSIIPYTHTQMTDPPVTDTSQASYSDFTYDGIVVSGDTYFNSGSTYFTNCYPGLFTMVAYNVDVTDFEIDGNIGADGDGQADTHDYTLTYGGIDYSVYSKRVWDAGDPSINHIFIVNTIDENITHNIDTTTEDDLDTISNITGVTQIHYLLFALSGGAKASNTQIENVVTSYLSIIDPFDLNQTLSNLNSGFTGITSNLPPNNLSKSLDYKQTNLTGDTESFEELLTFGEPSDNIINNYIGNYANTYNWDNNSFLLSNNVFYGNGSLAYVNNTFGNSCFNNTFDDDCTNNIIGNFFYNNTTDDDFDENIIGNYFYNNYITSNFQRNRIGDSFFNNTIITGSFYRNDIGNQFESNVITNGDFQNNEIGNGYNNNILNSQFYKNDVGNGFNQNKIYSNFYGNVIGGGYNENKIYSSFYDNQIGEVFEVNVIGNSDNFGVNEFRGNVIGNGFGTNNITGSTFNYNHIGDRFYSNDIYGSSFIKNQLGYEFYDNQIFANFENNTNVSTFFSNSIYYNFYSNQLGYNFQSNAIGDTGTIGAFTFQKNIIGTTFKSNQFGGCDFEGNTVKGDFTANNVSADILYNNFDYNFFVNNINGVMRENTIGYQFQFNTIQGTFQYNKIGSNFNDNTVGDGFGFGGGSYRGNVIGNNFYNNTIGEYFYDNTVGDNFTNNTVVNYFQMNRVCNSVTFNNFSSATHVYGFYNCEIFTNAAGVQRLSYYDSSDVLNITNITA